MTTSFAPCAATPQASAPDPTKHVNYTLGMVLGVDDFNQEFAYHSGRDQEIVRSLIGYGTASGLKVTTDTTTGKTRVLVTAGLAVVPQGEFVRVPKTQCAVLDDWVANNSAAIGSALGSTLAHGITIYVVLAYRQCPTDPVPIPGEPCRTAAQSMAPSRWTDDFQLSLGLDRPAPAWSEDLREFAMWLSTVEVSDATGPFATLAQFVAAVRSVGQLTSPLGLLNYPSPLSSLRVHSNDAPTFFRAAYRIWVTELRPAWSAAVGGDPPSETRVLLAELGVPVVFKSGQWQLDPSGTVSVNEDTRPFLVPTQLSQEWLDRSFGGDGTPVSAWGRFDQNGASLAPASQVSAKQPIATDKTVFLLSFSGWSSSASYVVTGSPLVGLKTASGAFFAVIRSDDPDLKTALGGSAPAGIVVRAGVPTGANTFGPVGFSVEITQVG